MTGISPTEKAQQVLKRLGIARSRDLERAGVSRTQLRRLLVRGLIERVGRGLYGLPGGARTERHHLAEAARRVPGGVVCLLSALRFHGLTTQNPFEVWMAIDRRAWRPRVEHPPLRLVHLSGPALREGVEEHDVGGVAVRVFSAAKTVADCFKFRNDECASCRFHRTPAVQAVPCLQGLRGRVAGGDSGALGGQAVHQVCY